jgi:hypothetical protein
MVKPYVFLCRQETTLNIILMWDVFVYAYSNLKIIQRFSVLIHYSKMVFYFFYGQQHYGGFKTKTKRLHSVLRNIVMFMLTTLE